MVPKWIYVFPRISKFTLLIVNLSVACVFVTSASLFIACYSVWQMQIENFFCEGYVKSDLQSELSGNADCFYKINFLCFRYFAKNVKLAIRFNSVVNH